MFVFDIASLESSVVGETLAKGSGLTAGNMVHRCKVKASEKVLQKSFCIWDGQFSFVLQKAMS